jgi:hypothetical protein
MGADDREFLVHFQRTLCLSLPAEDATLDSLKLLVEARERVPADRLELSVNGVLLDDQDAVPTAPAILRVRLTGGLLGGKGGFGAMLRSQGKGSSGKTTTNFGACRDLNGRRLRHVNQEIAMDKWRQETELREQRKKQGVSERELLDEETPSGIPGWYLATPAWAEGIKKSYMKRRRNTVMCSHWLQARAPGRAPPPANAPRWWGCPRGRDCDFAHGEDELRGQGLADYKRQKKDAAFQQKQSELNKYVNYEDDLPTSNNDMRDAVRQGMRARDATSKAAVEVAPVVVEVTLPTATSISVPEKWLEPVDGSVLATFQHGLCELLGKGNFGTATVPMGRLARGKWYYEVRLVTDDIIQLGWADAEAFTCDSDAGEGVGDHARSWSYDGARQRKWTAGIEEEYGQEWEAGDIIGCLYDAVAGVVAFSRNGEPLGEAFSSIKVPNGSGLVPAISLEKTEIVLVNIGVQPFLYAPAGYKAVAESIHAPLTKKQATDKRQNEDESPRVMTQAVTERTEAEKEVAPIELVDLEPFASAEALETLGLDGLKEQLRARNLKCGYVGDNCAPFHFVCAADL